LLPVLLLGASRSFKAGQLLFRRARSNRANLGPAGSLSATAAV